MKKYNLITVAVFLIFIFSFLFLQIITPSKSFSDLENRYLQQLPEFSFKELFDGDYTADFESYIEDQFPYRDTWITFKNELERLIGKQEVNGVYFGEDDYYFEVKDTYDAEQLLRNITYINLLNSKLEEQGIHTTFFPIYSSYMYYGDKLPTNAPVVNELEITEALKQYLEMDVVDSYEILQQHKDENLYFKSDHHWNQLGAYYAYTALADIYGFEANSLESYTKKCSDTPFIGTLYSKAPIFSYPGDEFCYYDDELEYSVYIHDTQETFDSLYFTENLSNKDKYVTFLGGNNGAVQISSNANTGRKLVMLKDSYSHALAPLLVAHFDEIVLIDMRYFKMPISQFMQEFQPTDVLYSYHVMWFSEDKNLFMLRN